MAKAAGLQVIITSSSDDKLARTRELGADETINYRTTPEWQDEVLRLTSGKGVDVVLEVGGEGTINRSIARSEEHTSELQSRGHLVCRLLLEKKKKEGVASNAPTRHDETHTAPESMTRENAATEA